MGNVSLDFEKIVNKAVKRYVFKDDVSKVVACIMKDYTPESNSPDSFFRSFEELARASNLETAILVFDEFLSDVAIEECLKSWILVENFRVRFAARMDAATAAEAA